MVRTQQGGTETATGICSAYLDVGLKGPDGFIQQLLALLFGQVDAVHAAAVELLEAVRARYAREGEEGQPFLTA